MERLRIQHGTSMVYPVSAIGAHVSDVPNHTVGRVTPFATRGNVALSGTFGYELDITHIPQDDRDLIPQQVATYHKYNDLIRTGDLYRIGDLCRDSSYDCWSFVAKDKSEVLMTYVQVLGRANYQSRCVRLKGLQRDAVYVLEETGQEFSGAVLMQGGFPVTGVYGDFSSMLFHFVRKK